MCVCVCVYTHIHICSFIYVYVYVYDIHIKSYISVYILDTDAANPLLTERLLVSPWWAIHSDVLKEALSSEMSRHGTVIALEVCSLVQV